MLRLPAFLVIMSLMSGVLRAAAPDASIFVHADDSAAAIYHDGWIDFNKNGSLDVYEDPARSVEERVTDLVSQMTLEEKTAQMVTLYGFPRVLKDELPTAEWKQRMWRDGIGNMDEHMNGNEGENGGLADPEYDLPWSLHVRARNEVQRWFVEQTRLGVPVDFTNEGIRGLLHSKATSFPAELAVASTWNRELVRAIGTVTGREAYLLGYTNVYSPVIDMARDPRWGRIIETYGEDPFLAGELAFEQVSAIQAQGVVSTVKHFTAYGIPKGGRDGYARTDPQATWNELQTVLIHPFRRAIRDAGALGVMASYNDYDGVPVEANPLFLTDILRREWGFGGYVVSDSAAVEFIFEKHRVAPTYPEAVRRAVAAGLNIRTGFTQPEVYVEPLRQLVRDGKLPMTTIDARVRDILRVKFWQGSFAAPYRTDLAAIDAGVRTPEARALTLQAAHESIILLKNDAGALPLAQTVRRVLVAGPLADDPHAWYSRYGPQRLEMVTPLAGIRAKLGRAVEVRYVKGVEVKDAAFPESDVLKEPPGSDVQAGIAAAVAAAADVDVIIACLGETGELCRESASRTSLNLPGYQDELLRALHATGRPVVLVLSNGRPLAVNWAAKHIPAIVEMWFGDESSGGALADVLFGDYNPAGRLPVTVPKTVGQVPFNFPAKSGSQDRDPGMVAGPLFAFGHGLSYTTFSYASLRIAPELATVGSDVSVTVDVTNTGNRAGDEVVQLYLRDDYASVTTPDQNLRGFERVHLALGEAKTVTFTIPAVNMQLYNPARQWVVEPGRFTVMVGAASDDIRLRGTFTLSAVDGSVPEEAPVPEREAAH